MSSLFVNRRIAWMHASHWETRSVVVVGGALEAVVRSMFSTSSSALYWTEEFVESRRERRVGVWSCDCVVVVVVEAVEAACLSRNTPTLTCELRNMADQRSLQYEIRGDWNGGG